MKSTYLTETLFSTTVLRLDFTAITVQLTHGGACASHGNPDETCDLVEQVLLMWEGANEWNLRKNTQTRLTKRGCKSSGITIGRGHQKIDGLDNGPQKKFAEIEWAMKCVSE